jgi:ATP-dependent exoDNAse (exonuclease V) beta subunit
MARQYEASGGISFRGFIDELRAAAASEGAEAPILEESSDGVRIMTVHKAKGLEFPVVILADMTCRMSRTDASRYLDLERGLCAMKIGGWAPHELHLHEAEEVARDEAEGVRLAYVAATRARDLLVVPAVGDEPWEGGWFSPLNRALYPEVTRRRDAARGPKCPAFKSKDTVLDRPNGEVAGLSTVCPGQHAMPGDYAVVWWDPGTGGGLTLGAEAPFGVRRQDLIVKDVPRDVIADGRSEYDRWKLARADARAQGAVASIALATVREWAAAETAATPAGAAAVDVATIDLAEPGAHDGRAGGAVFGVLVHALLARAPLDASADELADIARREARLLEATPADADAAALAAGRVLAHDIGRRARAALARGACRRETPVSLTMPDGTMVEGVVDLAFEESGQWHVVDFKSDRWVSEVGEAQYRRQVGLYAEAISKATGKSTTGTILRI